MRSRTGRCAARLLCLGALWVAVAARGAQTQRDDFPQRLALAAAEAEQGDLAAAMVDVKAVLAEDPARADGWYELGSVLGQAGDFKGSEAALRRAIELKPDMARAHFSLALTLIANPQDKQDWAGAMTECRAALKIQPEYAQALNLLGAGLNNEGQADEAIEALRKALALAPGLAEAHFNLALALQNKDQLDEAGVEYRAAISARGAYPEASSALGALELRMGKPSDAERDLDAALRVNPDLGDAHYALARTLHSLKREEEAGVEFAETKDLSERQGNGIQASQMSNRGLELAGKGDLGGAAALVRKAIALKPDYGVPHYNLGLILADGGELAGATQELEKAISLMPGQARPWFDLGRVRHGAGDAKGAIECIAWAARLAPTDAAIHKELATLRGVGPVHSADAEAAQGRPRVGAATDSLEDHVAFAHELSARGDAQGAVGELLRALAVKPADVVARRALAQAYTRLGDELRAILEYRKVLRCAPEDAAAHVSLGDLLLARGDAEAAEREMRLAVRFAPGSADAQGGLRRAEKAFSKH